MSELLIIDHNIREILASRPSMQAIRDAARQTGMQTLRESAMAQVLSGVTSIEEIVRATK